MRIEDLPSSTDWATFGATTPVKNQGNCGSCWSFAGTEAIESAVFLDTGIKMVLAPQAYVDCVDNSQHCGGSGGCDGATCDLLFANAVHHGACYESEYPYRANQSKCEYYEARAKIQGWTDVPSNNDTELMMAVSRKPITISVGASTWHSYSGGVFPFDDCDFDINHAVLLVGYGTDPSFGDYWKVQNSWGPTWGEGGFIRLQRRTDCGVDKTPLDGTGCPGGPSEVTVCGTCGMLYDSVYPLGATVA